MKLIVIGCVVHNRAALYNKVDILEFLIKRVSTRTVQKFRLLLLLNAVLCTSAVCAIHRRAGQFFSRGWLPEKYFDSVRKKLLI